MHGTGVSAGISIGKAFVLQRSSGITSGVHPETEEQRKSEAEKFDRAAADSVREIEALIVKKREILKPDEVSILETQIEFLTDPQIRTDVLDKVNNERKNAAEALIEVIAGAVAVFENLEDEYMRERATDIRDAGLRILKFLNSGYPENNTELPDNAILIADDISPSDIISLEISKIAGIATSKGGNTSHAAIIARSRGIPSVVGCGDGLSMAVKGELIIVDGTSGEVILNPDNNTIEKYTLKQKNFTRRMELLEKIKDLPAVTRDGCPIILSANISGPGDLDSAYGNGAEGIGLFRTEMIFMNRDTLPGEEEQFRLYRSVAARSGNKPVIIRTLDIGGDKNAPCLDIPHEDNPFLGFRAIRFCLDHRDIFLTQIKAILRAGLFGTLKIMFPMITTLEEVREARKCLEQAKYELTGSGIDFNRTTETGIMIETPAAALTSDQLAREVDFFSIGTNDLCQYTLAVDRMNEKVSSLYSHFHPAVLKLIHYSIEQGRLNNIHTGLCGEMASDPLATLPLLGMGLREFSMSAPSLPLIKNIIRNTDITRAEEVWESIRGLSDQNRIIDFLKENSDI